MVLYTETNVFARRRRILAKGLLMSRHAVYQCFTQFVDEVQVLRRILSFYKWKAMCKSSSIDYGYKHESCRYTVSPFNILNKKIVL